MKVSNLKSTEYFNNVNLGIVKKNRNFSDKSTSLINTVISSV